MSSITSDHWKQLNSRKLGGNATIAGNTEDLLVFDGTLVHSTGPDSLQITEDGIIGVREGKIIFVDETKNLSLLQEKYDFTEDQIHHLSKSEFLLPGLIDTHIHAPQYINCGLGLDHQLLDWLKIYTYPTEAKFSDLDFARDVYNKVVRRTLHNGTTMACYFGTIHREATELLCDIIINEGQRAYVGKVSMDRSSVQYYTEATATSIKETEEFIKAVFLKKSPLVSPVVTPRFAGGCSETLMLALATVSRKYRIFVQTHLSENKDECALVQKLFPDCDNYVDVYSKMSLLTKKTVMAHGIHLCDAELELLRTSAAGISHCPISNNSLRSGMCDVRGLLDRGIKVGLGTDCSAGYSPSMLDAMRSAIQTSHNIAISKLATEEAYQHLTYKEAIFLATLGGAQVLGMADKLGSFQVGKQFDALQVDMDCAESRVHIYESDTAESLVQKFVFLGDDRNIVKVYVAGHSVKN